MYTFNHLIHKKRILPALLLLLLLSGLLFACSPSGESAREEEVNMPEEAVSADPGDPTSEATSEAISFKEVAATVEAEAAQATPATTPRDEPTLIPTVVSSENGGAPASESTSEPVESATPSPTTSDTDPQESGEGSDPAREATPEGTIDSASVNGVPIEEIVIMPDEVKENVRQIYLRGQSIGRDSGAFSKLGDSLIATPHYLTPFDTHAVNLGQYDYLQDAIAYYAGSFERIGVAVHAGLHSWGVFDPLWANKDWCQPNEDMLACEVRLNNPSVLFIHLGSNDSGSPGNFDYNLRKVVEFALEQGIIPIIATKADRFEGPDNINNTMLRQIAADFQVPLWEFDRVADSLPGRGLREDQVHLTENIYHDYSVPEIYDFGHAIHNLTGLMMLDAILETIQTDG